MANLIPVDSIRNSFDRLSRSRIIDFMNTRVLILSGNSERFEKTGTPDRTFVVALQSPNNISRINTFQMPNAILYRKYEKVSTRVSSNFTIRKKQFSENISIPSIWEMESTGSQQRIRTTLTVDHTQKKNI